MHYDANDVEELVQQMKSIENRLNDFDNEKKSINSSDKKGDLTNYLSTLIKNTYNGTNITFLDTFKSSSYSIIEMSFNIGNTKIKSNVHSTNFEIKDDFEFKFLFDNKDNIFKTLKIEEKNFNEIINAFYETARKFNVITNILKKNDNYELKQSVKDKDFYYFPLVDSHKIYYTEGFRQRKSIDKNPNKSSNISYVYSFKINKETNKFESFLNIKFPFLYKSKINFDYNCENYSDIEEIKNNFEKVYMLKIKNHFQNILKIKIPKLLSDDIPYYKSLIEMSKY